MPNCRCIYIRECLPSYNNKRALVITLSLMIVLSSIKCSSCTACSLRCRLIVPVGSTTHLLGGVPCKTLILRRGRWSLSQARKAKALVFTCHSNLSATQIVTINLLSIRNITPKYHCQKILIAFHCQQHFPFSLKY